jgi:ATP-dependent Clp protease ATP-binding subunit ClpC
MPTITVVAKWLAERYCPIMRSERFTERAQDAAVRASEILQRYGHNQVDTEHFLLALLEQPDGIIPRILEKLKVNVDAMRYKVDELLRAQPRSAVYDAAGTGQIFLTPRVKRIMDLSFQEAQRLGDEYISTEHIFLAILSEKRTAVARLLEEASITRERVEDVVRDLRGGQRVTDPMAESRYKMLEKYSRDLTALAREGRLDPVVGRDGEILRVIQILSRRTKNNPVLIGEAGVGKTAIVEGLAQKIANGDVPEILLGKSVLSLDLSGMVAGSRFRGEFEERLKATMEEIQRSAGEIILFIDELHQVVGAGAASGAMDASNMMKPALARGELNCIGATTLDEFRQYIEADSALDRRFAPVYVEEPSVEDTIQMLMGLRHRYEEHHRVRFSNEALVSAARLSHRYIADRKLPDKAIDLMDEAAAKLRVALYSMPDDLKDLKKQIEHLTSEMEYSGEQQDYERAANLKMQLARVEDQYEARLRQWKDESALDEIVTENDIADVLAQWTGIPTNQLMENEAERLLKMEEILHQRIIGQEEPIAVLADAIRRARSGLKDPNRPIGSFIFLGSSGVGKTELAKALAEFMFDDEEALVRIDMSEYREQHTVSRLFGAPPGYVGYEEGGQLTEAIRRRPYRVVLFDEIEKAHPEIWNALLQVLDEGHLTDGQGRRVDFRNTVIIMTSNLGTEYIKQGGALGFLNPNSAESVTDERKIEKAMQDAFRPEFLNRLDEIIIFKPLALADMVKIVDLQMQGIAERLGEQGLIIELTQNAREWLAEEGFDPQFGARPLRRTLQRFIESPLSVKLLKGDFRRGDVVVVDSDGAELIFTKREGGSYIVPVAEYEDSHSVAEEYDSYEPQEYEDQ